MTTGNSGGFYVQGIESSQNFLLAKFSGNSSLHNLFRICCCWCYSTRRLCNPRNSITIHIGEEALRNIPISERGWRSALYTQQEPTCLNYRGQLPKSFFQQCVKSRGTPILLGKLINERMENHRYWLTSVRASQSRSRAQNCRKVPLANSLTQGPMFKLPYHGINVNHVS